MNIRIMTIADYPNVYELWTSTAGMGMRSIDDSKAGIRRFLSRNPLTSFVAESDEAIIGAILCGHDGRRGYIYHACVHAKYRGNAIGTKLVNAALDALSKEGINKAALVVFKNNETGNSFWEASGWEERLDLNYFNKNLNDENR